MLLNGNSSANKHGESGGHDEIDFDEVIDELGVEDVQPTNTHL